MEKVVSLYVVHDYIPEHWCNISSYTCMVCVCLDYIIIVHYSHQKRSLHSATYSLSQIKGHSSVLFTLHTIDIVEPSIQLKLIIVF